MTRSFFDSFATIAVLACLAIGVPLDCSAQGKQVSVHVPFDFQISGTPMSAGRYIFESPINGGMIYLTSVETGERYASIGMPVGNPSDSRSPQVVFERIGEKYRLSEVWLNSGATGCGIQPTKAEKQYAKQFGRGNMIALSIRR